MALQWLASSIKVYYMFIIFPHRGGGCKMITFQFVPSRSYSRPTSIYGKKRSWALRGKNVNRQNTLGNGDESMNVSCKLEMNITTSNPLRAADCTIFSICFHIPVNLKITTKIVVSQERQFLVPWFLSTESLILHQTGICISKL